MKSKYVEPQMEVLIFLESEGITNGSDNFGNWDGLV